MVRANTRCVCNLEMSIDDFMNPKIWSDTRLPIQQLRFSMLGRKTVLNMWLLYILALYGFVYFSSFNFSSLTSMPLTHHDSAIYCSGLWTQALKSITFRFFACLFHYCCLVTPAKFPLYREKKLLLAVMGSSTATCSETIS